MISKYLHATYAFGQESIIGDYNIITTSYYLIEGATRAVFPYVIDVHYFASITRDMSFTF